MTMPPFVVTMNDTVGDVKRTAIQHWNLMETTAFHILVHGLHCGGDNNSLGNLAIREGELFELRRGAADE